MPLDRPRLVKLEELLSSRSLSYLISELSSALPAPSFDGFFSRRRLVSRFKALTSKASSSPNERCIANIQGTCVKVVGGLSIDRAFQLPERSFPIRGTRQGLVAVAASVDWFRSFDGCEVDEVPFYRSVEGVRVVDMGFPRLRQTASIGRGTISCERGNKNAAKHLKHRSGAHCHRLCYFRHRSRQVHKKASLDAISKRLSQWQRLRQPDWKKDWTDERGLSKITLQSQDLLMESILREAFAAGKCANYHQNTGR